jgi:hypothetical protein
MPKRRIAALSIRRGWPGAMLLAASALAATWFALAGGIIFQDDADSFFSYATGLDAETQPYFRAIGYPILIVLTGYPWTKSLVPLLGLQATFAALTPWLAFKAFGLVDISAGILAGVVCLASLTPFFFQNEFYHDGACLFFGFLSVTFAAYAFATHKPVYQYLSLISAAFAYLVLPVVIGFFIGCAAALMVWALYSRVPLTHFIESLCLSLAVMIGVSLFQTWSLRKYSGPNTTTSLNGRLLFHNEYLQSAPFGGFDVAGGAGEELRRRLVDYFGDPAFDQSFITSRVSEREYRDLFAPYVGQASLLVNQMFAHPNAEYYHILMVQSDTTGGVGDDVFFRAAVSYAIHHPLIVLGYVWENFVGLAVGYLSCGRLSKLYVYLSSDMPVEATRFLSSRKAPDGLLMRTADAVWCWNYTYVRVPAVLLVLFGWIASLFQPGPLRWTFGAIIIGYIGSLLVYSLLVLPGDRYQVLGMAILAFAAGAGVYSVAAGLGRVLGLCPFTGSRSTWWTQSARSG